MHIINLHNILKHLLVDLLAAANIVKIVKINNVLILYVYGYKITIYSYHIEKYHVKSTLRDNTLILR